MIIMKHLYNTLAILVLVLLGTAALQANEVVRIQNTFKQVNAEEIQMQKIAFYSEQLQLTTEEAQNFWPLYNEYWAECGKARSKTMKALKALENATSPEAKTSDEEVERLAEEYLASFKAESEIPTDYFEKFAKILPVKKAARVFYTEEKFRRMLIKQFRAPHPPKGN